MTRKAIELTDKDWRADFDSVRIDQMLRFREFSLRHKFQMMENMAEFVRTVHARRSAAGKPDVKP